MNCMYSPPQCTVCMYVQSITVCLFGDVTWGELQTDSDKETCVSDSLQNIADIRISETVKFRRRSLDRFKMGYTYWTNFESLTNERRRNVPCFSFRNSYIGYMTQSFAGLFDAVRTLPIAETVQCDGAS